jgi:hypothetical protein
MSVEYFLENIIPSQPLIRNGRAARYYEDCVFYEDHHNIAPQIAAPEILVPI